MFILLLLMCVHEAQANSVWTSLPALVLLIVTASCISVCCVDRWSYWSSCL